jgi:hypothetical protein
MSVAFHARANEDYENRGIDIADHETCVRSLGNEQNWTSFISFAAAEGARELFEEFTGNLKYQMLVISNIGLEIYNKM